MPDYSVRLVLRVSADSPDRAAPTFIAHMIENGFTDWVYQICDPDDDMKVIGYFDGFGLPVDVDKLHAASADEPEPAPPAVQTPVQTEETDAELLTLAQDLNDADAPPAEQQPTPATE